MLYKMENALRMILGHGQHQKRPKPPLLSAAEATQLSWANSIKSLAEVPAAYKDFFESLLAEGEEFPYTVLTPSYKGFLHRAAEKLVCVLSGELHILERRGSTFEAQSFPLNGISCVEVRTMLLDSSINITGVTKQGIPAVSTLRFNSVTDYLFTPIVERIRSINIDSRGAVQRSELERFDDWMSLNYKFMNYAKRSLLGAEKVVHATLQPEIRAEAFTVLGRTFHRTVSPTQAIILTDSELITIREEATRRREDRYGGVWDYIPLNKIAGLSILRQDNGLLMLSVQLPESVHLDYLFQASAQGDVDQIQDRFGVLTQRYS
jgi:hypothetical protein